jgi:two-component system NtrC family sensor kinase
VVSDDQRREAMTELKRQFSGALLVILTVAALISAGINFQQQNKFRLPDDGVTWMDRGGRVEALHVVAGGPAGKAGIKAGDVLRQISGAPVQEAVDVARILLRIGAWNPAKYSIERSGVPIVPTVFVGERTPEPSLYYQYLVGLAYLAIGLFVYFRRGNAKKARHFYILCLASFVLSTFHYTGKLNNFDKVIYWGNVAAGLLAPTIFLHFCLTFPEAHRWIRGKGRSVLVYVPAAFLMLVFLGVASGAVRVAIPSIELRWILDRVWLAFLAASYAAGAIVLSLQYGRAEDPIVRQQLKWLRNGAVFGIVPFLLFYVAPYSLGAIPGPYMKMAVLSLAIIPLTWAYAVLRYRLMDVDSIFQQGYAYTLATLCILSLFYGLIFSLGKFDNLSPAEAFLLILIAAFVFQPVRGWIQVQLDKYYFYKDHYDYRRTLIEFAKELSSETDLDAMLASVADRLVRTLSVSRVAFFLADENERGFRLRTAFGMTGRDGKPLESDEGMDLSFLTADTGKTCIFFEWPRHLLDVPSRRWPAAVRKTIAELDLTYYVPCSARGRTIAYLGVSRTDKGDFLPSDDLELLVTLSGYVAIAVENARLYRSLQWKIEENERLKEFNENIVESINVGILAVDLDDRVESWNSQMEKLSGIPRERALGQPLAALFPAELTENFDRVREESGIHHVYKFPLRLRDMSASGVTPVNGKGLLEMPPAERAPDSESPEIISNIAIAPLVSRDEERIGRLIIFDDVTLREELERRLVQADKLSSIGLLAAGVAHEVNTPLAVISTYAQMLAKQVGGDQQKSALLDKIAKQTFRASEIVNSLLDFSRTSPRQFGEVELARVLRETLTLVEHQFEKSGIRVSLEVQEPLPSIRGNTGQLQQVFLNLYLNARDAMEQGGSLHVRAWEGGHGVHVEIADTGPGIAPEHLQRIYDPFFTTKSARKGTGLGLSITYGIVRDHGGLIEVESKPGEGTTFHLDFPALRKAVNA